MPRNEGSDADERMYRHVRQSELEIEGRSSMKKAELVHAIRERS